MFAETAIVEYRLSFAEQGKPTSVFRFRLQQTNGSCHFCFSFAECKRICCLFHFPFAKFRKHGDMEIEMWMYCRESNLAVSSSPVINNNVQFIVGPTATMGKLRKFLAVRRVSA
jgi:hypothetical protein